MKLPLAVRKYLSLGEIIHGEPNILDIDLLGIWLGDVGMDEPFIPLSVFKVNVLKHNGYKWKLVLPCVPLRLRSRPYSGQK